MSEKPATVQTVSWDAVRALAVAIGVRPAARKLGVSEEAAMKRSQREGWLSDPMAARAHAEGQALRRSSAMVVREGPQSLNPAQVMAQELLSLGSQSRLSLAKGVQKASAHVASLEGAEILERSGDVKAIAQTADLVHGWKDQAPNVKIRLDVLNAPSEQQVYDVESHVEMDVTFSDSESTEVDDY